MEYISQSFKKRPPRLKIIFNRNPLYFVTCCTYNRRPLLAYEIVHDVFRRAAGQASMAGNAVGRYVIMPDQIHMFLRIGMNNKLGAAVKCIREAITRLLHQDDRNLHVWQAGFFDHMMRSSESYAEKWLYVSNNPVRVGLCDSADKWPYQGEIVIIRW
ncbi:MAG: transposase [Kiritimatiellia bacterium]